MSKFSFFEPSRLILSKCLWSAVCISLSLTTAKPGSLEKGGHFIVVTLSWWRQPWRQRECFGEAEITAAAAAVLCRQRFLCDVLGDLNDPHGMKPGLPERGLPSEGLS